MFIEIIKGAIGSGKTFYMLNSIKEKLRESGRKNVIIVPEQFSYAFEKLVVENFGGAGLNNVEVITLSRMVSRYLERRNEKYLTPSGKMMIVYRAVMSLESGSLFYGCAKKPGFVEAVSEIVSEFTEYMITPEILRRKAEITKNNLLKEKLIAIADILEEYLRLTEGNFYDSEEDILALAEYAQESRCFEGYNFWFDSFSVFLPQHYRIMSAFLKTDCEVHVSVCADSGERELYDVNRVIERRLERLAQETGAELFKYETDDICRSIKSGEMAFLLENIDRWSDPGFAPWEEPTKDISLFVCKDLYSEVRHIALSIRKIIMEQGFRYRDIAVVCGNIEGYSHIIEAVFNDFNIPYFSDVQISAAEHPVSMLILSVFDILVENWSYASLFRYLRTGYIYMKNEEGKIMPFEGMGVDLLENYVLKYGIRGKSVWMDDEKWEKAQGGVFGGILENSSEAFTRDEIESINAARKTLIKPFLNLYESVSGRRTVREFAAALFEFLNEIYLFEGLSLKAADFDKDGLRNEAEQLRMIWNVIIETLNQSVVVMGEEKCSREDFAGIIRAGLSAVTVSIIPSGLDRVAVSSVERSRQHDAEIMFIMGAVFGAIPKETLAGGLLTDNDRILLRDELLKDGLEIAADTQKRNDMDRFNFFSTLFGVSEKVYITYPAADTEGNVQRPASIISEFYRVFPNMTTGDNIVKTNDADFLYSPKTAYNYMLANFKRGGLAGDIYRWYEKNLPERLNIIKEAVEYKKNDAGITPENAKKLYEGSRQYSVSRLNEYGKCPFGYFVKYGLKAKEQEIWQIQKFDLGSIMHMAVQMYCEMVDNNAASFEELRNNWINLTDKESRTYAAEIMERIKNKIINGVTRDENKIRYIIMRMQKIVEKSVELVRRSMASGEYAAVCYEQKFRIEIKWNDKEVMVNGVIDRLDMARSEDKKLAELRVVDYKTGKKNFSVVSICNKQDIQLVMYALAAVEMYRSGGIKYAEEGFEPKLRAVVYNHMRDDVVAVKNEEEGERAKIMESRPDGLIVLDKDEDGYDMSAVFRLDEKLLQSKESEIMRVGLKKDETPTEKSQVTSSDAFDILMDYVKKSVIEIDNEIFDGIIKIYPACEGQNKSCDWCAFEEICLYNERFDEKRGLVTKEDEAWEIMKKEVEEDE